MAASTRHPTLRLTGRSVLRGVAMLGATLALLAVLGASGRVVGWILAAAVLAGLFHPVVDLLDRHVPRGVALAVVLVSSLAILGGIAYAVVDEVTHQVDELEEAVPEAARDIERSERFGEVARELRLAERAEDFVEELPERLRGGEVDEALRSAATRGVAFLATTVLTIFFLIHGPRLLQSALRQLPPGRRDDVRVMAVSAYRRGWNYVAGSLVMATMAGVIAYTCADLLDLPGAAPLALWVALFDLVPLVGLLLGAVPLVLLAATTATWEATVGVTIVLVAWQLFEALRLQRRVEAVSLHIGPFVTVVVAFVGLELYGIGGVFVGLVLVVLAAAALDETLGRGPRSARPRPSPEEMPPPASVASGPMAADVAETPLAPGSGAPSDRSEPA